MFKSTDALSSKLALAGYFIDPVMTQVVFLAAKLQKPLLLEGPAGSGQTQLATSVIVSFMYDVELTEQWLFERQRLSEERKLRDPEDAYLEVQRQEGERAEKGLPPRVQFLKGADEDAELVDQT